MIFEYPTADDIHALHETIVAEDDDTDAGIRKPDDVESALVYVSEGYFGEVPETIHEKAAHLARLIATNHPYVDGNKRTALATATMLYNLNGYEFDWDDRWMRHILHDFATEGTELEMASVVRRFEGWAKHYTHE